MGPRLSALSGTPMPVPALPFSCPLPPHPPLFQLRVPGAPSLPSASIPFVAEGHWPRAGAWGPHGRAGLATNTWEEPDDPLGDRPKVAQGLGQGVCDMLGAEEEEPGGAAGDGESSRGTEEAVR